MGMVYLHVAMMKGSAFCLEPIGRQRGVRSKSRSTTLGHRRHLQALSRNKVGTLAAVEGDKPLMAKGINPLNTA